MNADNRWINLEGAVNVRDLGGLATTSGGATGFGRVIRADGLQDLTPADIEHITSTLDVHDVIDLRSEPEVRLSGPGPLTRVDSITIHHLSLFAETEKPDRVDVDRTMPWHRAPANGATKPLGSTGHYLRYCTERPDSVVAALRIIARGAGATIVHCAAGKDRTGVVCALAMDAIGVRRDAIVADYVQTGDRMPDIVARLRANVLYAADVAARPLSSMQPQPSFIRDLLNAFDDHFGGVRQWLGAHGWTEDDHRELQGRLLD
ncbi:tyrosine-protein phosphatase [Nocardia sp. NPDC004604]|uniref:tyrosine-protein phosphatase n=1 Tax=Nocardia sp. NPDC004604 TaxID=3157013 RepID=UPI0033BE391F